MSGGLDRRLGRRRRVARIALTAFGLAVCAPAVSAEIYKCTGPDGKTSFVGDPSQCKGARPHELKKEIHREDAPASGAKARAPSSGERASAPARRAVRPARATGAAAAGASGSEQVWRRKQAEARAKLADVEERLQRGREMVTGCNRGSSWWGTDESGIRRNIPCTELRSQVAALEQEREELAAYVGGGLAEECRRAGCLPGWLR